MTQAERGRPRLTVAIPLFRAERWARNVVENIRAMPPDVRIVLSDEVGSDDTAARIARHLASDPRIVLRLRRGAPGWREHCNALIAKNETEFFSLLPQDDALAPGYHAHLLAALDANPRAGIAFGTLVMVGRTPKPRRLKPPPIPIGASLPWIEAILLERTWNLGIPFRGVIRREVLRAIPATPNDHFADQVWVFGMALSAFLVDAPEAVYYKRYHEGNTHGSWAPPTPGQRRAQLVGEIRKALEDKEDADRAIAFLEQASRVVVPLPTSTD